MVFLSTIGLTLKSFGLSEYNRVNSRVMVFLSTIRLILAGYGLSEYNRVNSRKLWSF